ncbi:ABATE domain-containing protein [Umezawaea sp. Da 62-37]|uniref:CGNR zinc finger domain-containing protein n=1 Tax=Umezawaea sp. Da 62-37 TaxID=3075927 RepID=UPI0028F6FD42|nr:ABATE domain-containing protein [Umezawaea sp. Da 62-37]WNV83629.1 ABATE domain-containing protein [Umezawaea sp. Da 62-37]
MDIHPALAFVGTVRYERDDLGTSAGFADWLGLHTDAPVALAADDEVRARVVALRRAVRTLFARAVEPEAPSQADADRLLDPGAALDQVNEAAGAVLRAPRLEWPSARAPRITERLTEADQATRLVADLARVAIEFLVSEDRDKLRACPAPRCVKYFVRDHPRQAWCKPSCGNRARASRYYQRHHVDSDG